MKLTKTIISKISLISFISLVSFVSLVSSCGGGGDDDLGAPQTAAVNNELVPITFNGSQGAEAAVTRAAGTPLSDKNIEWFRVWGSKDLTGSTHQVVFPGYDVNWVVNTAYTTTTNTNNWDYILTGKPEQTIKYWDWAASAYRFFAATNWEGATPATIGDYTLNKTYGNTVLVEANANYSVSMLVDASPMLDGQGKYDKDASDIEFAKAPYFSRLWYSTGNPTDYPDKQFGKPVTLEFVQPYARVRFIYTYVYPREGITLSDQKFKPTDGDKKIYRKGIVKVTYPLEGDTKESYSMNVTDPADAAHLEAFTEDYDPDDDTKDYTTCDKGWYTVIPNLTQGSYTLTVSINNVEKTAVVPAEYMKWLPGYSYTYIFKITDKGGIEIGWVDYKVTKWTEMEVSREVYNW